MNDLNFFLLILLAGRNVIIFCLFLRKCAKMGLQRKDIFDIFNNEVNESDKTKKDLRQFFDKNSNENLSNIQYL